MTYAHFSCDDEEDEDDNPRWPPQPTIPPPPQGPASGSFCATHPTAPSIWIEAAAAAAALVDGAMFFFTTREDGFVRSVDVSPVTVWPYFCISYGWNEGGWNGARCARCLRIDGVFHACHLDEGVWSTVRDGSTVGT